MHISTASITKTQLTIIMTSIKMQPNKQKHVQTPSQNNQRSTKHQHKYSQNKQRLVNSCANKTDKQYQRVTNKIH